MSTAHNTTDHSSKAANTGRENVRVINGAAQDAMQSGLNSASESAQRFTDQVTQAFGMSGEGSEKLTRQASQNFAVITEAGATLTRGFQDISREWFAVMQERLQKNLDGFSALARCQSVPDFMAVQSGLMRDNLERTIEGTRRIAEVSTRVANEATQTVTAQTKKAHRAA